MKTKLTIISLVASWLILICCSNKKEQSKIEEPIGIEESDPIIDGTETLISDSLELNLEQAGFKDEYPKEIMLVAFKEEQNLQVYAKTETGAKLIKNYQFHGFSGQLGPKLKQGDFQIPEGIYKVEFLNPHSSYHLSIKVSYPNAFDVAKSKFKNIKAKGGDIFIHGKSATVGCIPIGDKGIEEVYLLAEKALANEIKVIISPRDFRVNAEYPNIEHIDWEDDLYDIIRKELNAIK